MNTNTSFYRIFTTGIIFNKSEVELSGKVVKVFFGFNSEKNARNWIDSHPIRSHRVVIHEK